ncbi:MAG TPA: hypothetical protein VMM15_42715 [Bradyrhizobium sp.]|nr:hypothetical protein [Bradyrhizobium sp.]
MTRYDLDMRAVSSGTRKSGLAQVDLSGISVHESALQGERATARGGLPESPALECRRSDETTLCSIALGLHIPEKWTTVFAHIGIFH